VIRVAVLLLTMTEIAAERVLLPAASRAMAVIEWAPLAAVVVFHETVYGDEVSSAPRLTPSSLNCTPATPTLSEAVAVSETVVPETVVPAAGAVTETVGGVVSGGAVVPMVKLSTTLPCVQVVRTPLISFVPPPEGPQRNEPWMEVPEKRSFMTPRVKARKADQVGCVQVAQRQVPSCSMLPPPVPTVRWVTPL